ncbi:stage III sporulation protein AA [Sediminibacillus dalangtanensis]|uniref:Stage III sporulation protein AA n=1 Tax=Sediminibacillus dalangtanensis TaxID=2729421 RepID=A0ABX7VTD7_9BACI|nr:stage III sporulation protein AA [Sediminibacillus dalangtanensis]QTM99798.1 stage III sporulation protein AA [Sediminibacillus dalangtanensis]
MEEILRLFSEPSRTSLASIIGERWTSLQEIRVRLSRPIELIFDSRNEWANGLILTKEDGIYLLNQISQFSLYRLEDELREGFITIEGGHRIGLSGKVNTVKGSVKAIKDISSFNIRIAKEKQGSAEGIIPFLYEKDYLNTLIIGPPQTGKTTMLRDLVRLVSSGWGQAAGRKAAVIDERSEIGGSVDGIPQHDLGPRTDIMDACPKADGMMMMIRSMSPEVLLVDEIGSEKDVQALMEAIYAGVKVICSIHGDYLHELKKRPSLLPLFDSNAFQRYVVLEKKVAPGAVKWILNGNGERIERKQRCRQNEVDRSDSAALRNYVGRF